MDTEFIIEAVVILVGLAISFAYYPQALRIIRTRSADDVSILSYGILSVGTTTYFLYGLYTNDPVLIVGFVFGAIGAWLVLFLTLYFRREKRTSRTPPNPLKGAENE